MCPDDFQTETALLSPAVPSHDPSPDDPQSRADRNMAFEVLGDESLAEEIEVEILCSLRQTVKDLRDNKRKAKGVRKANRPLIGENVVRRVLLLQLIREHQRKLETARAIPLTNNYLVRSFILGSVLYFLRRTPFLAAVTVTQIYCAYYARETLDVYRAVDPDGAQQKNESQVSKDMKNIRDNLKKQLPLTVSEKPPYRFISHKPTRQEEEYFIDWLRRFGDCGSAMNNNPASASIPIDVLPDHERESVDAMKLMEPFLNPSQFNTFASRAGVSRFEAKLRIPDFKNSSARGPDLKHQGEPPIPEYQPERIKRAIARRKALSSKAFSAVYICVDSICRGKLDQADRECNFRLERDAAVVRVIGAGEQVSLRTYPLFYENESKTEYWNIWVSGLGWIVWRFDFNEDDSVEVACRVVAGEQTRPLPKELAELNKPNGDTAKFDDWTQFPNAWALLLWLDTGKEDPACYSEDQIIQFIYDLGTNRKDAQQIARSIWSGEQLVSSEQLPIALAKAMGLPDWAAWALNVLEKTSNITVEARPPNRLYADRGKTDMHEIKEANTMKALIFNGPESETKPNARRRFLKGAGTAAAVAAAIPLEPLLGAKETSGEGIDIGVVPNNGDGARFADHSALWHKAILHDDLEIVNQAAWSSFTKALASGNFTDFQNIIVGNPGATNFTGMLNDPMVSFGFDLEGLDYHATSVPPLPSVTSAQEAAEAVEHYWASLLRDVSFIDYPNNSLVDQAVADLNNLSFVKSANVQGPPFPVTPQNLFRGQTATGDGNVKGPFVSQFMIQPISYGGEPLNQQFEAFLPGQDFMTTVDEFKRIQNGQVPTASLAFDSQFRFLRNGRSLAAFTHVDSLHQAYFTAAMVLLGIDAPFNPDNPYVGSQTQHGFGTLGRSDPLRTISEMATRALKSVWFHKWVVNLRHRPENYGALVQAALTNRVPFPQAAGALHPDVFKSLVLPIIHDQFNSFLLPQAFPEGAPLHPCYPSGHGTVGGACITAIKFFFDGNQPIRPLLLAAGSDVMQPSSDGTTLVPYAGADRDSLTVNGELLKLAWNLTTGHGIHAGIHFRSSSYWSIILGEQIGLRMLQDQAKTYNEPLMVNITKLDGTIAIIRNDDYSRKGGGV